MTEGEIEIRNRIAKDRTEYRDTVLSLKESHIVMNALWKLEALEKDNAALRERLEKAVELPAKVMIERTLVDGKFKPTQKAQAFNGRIGVVYRDEKRWKGLLVDICSEKVYDYDAAEARLAELNQK